MKNSQRTENLKKEMAKTGIDVIICRLPENILFLSGYWPMAGNAWLVFPLEGKPTCIAPRCFRSEAERELWDAETAYYDFGTLNSGDANEQIDRLIRMASNGKDWQRVGVEDDFETLAPPWNVAEPVAAAASTQRLLSEIFKESALVGITDVINRQRACKTAYELAKLKTANEIASLGLEVFARQVAPGISGVELVAEIEKQIMIQGTGHNNSARVRAFAQVATGAAETAIGYRPNEIATRRKMKSGDLALLELAVVCDGYWADRTRVRVAGRPTPQQKDIFEIVKAAQQAAINLIRAGAKAADIDRAARDCIGNAGFEKEFVHITGHGIGFRYHEPIPKIEPTNDLMLEAGMLTTIEPGIYLPAMGGIRLEDDVAVTEKGFEVLGPFERTLV